MLEFCGAHLQFRLALRSRPLPTFPNRAFTRIDAKRHRMILLHGAIEQLLWNDNVCKHDEVRFLSPGRLFEGSTLESWRCGEHQPQIEGRPKLFRMTTFANLDLQPIWNDTLVKKMGEGWGGALFMPNGYPVRIAVLSEHRERRTSLPGAQNPVPNRLAEVEV